MIVHHFSTSTSGGAGGAARRLHESLRQNQIASRLYSSDVHLLKDDSFQHMVPSLPEFDLRRKIIDRLNGSYYFRKNYQRHLDHFLKNRPDGYESFDFVKLPYPTPIPSKDEKPDLIHLHWVSGLIDYPSFFSSIPDAVPIVWTLHDMNAFTGGCHYSWACTNYRSECGNCPQLNDHRSDNDLSHRNWNIKLEYLRSKNLHFVAPSNWLMQRASESKMFSNRSFFHIPYGIDLNSFVPKDKELCRKLLSLDQTAFVVAFGAEAVTNRRKGLREFAQSLKHLQIENLIVLLFGEGGAFHLQESTGRLRDLGFVGSSDLLTIIYSAADVFVLASLHENLSQMALESLACGTPVVAFPVGGNPDMVTKESGLLSNAVTPEDLAASVQWLCDHPDERKQMGINGRKMMKNKFSLQAQAQKYIELYQRILSER